MLYVYTYDETLKGDIKLFVTVENSTNMKREGVNLKFKKEISLKESLSGFKFDIKHINGKTYTINNTNGKVIHPLYIKTIPHMGMKREKPHPAPPIVGDLIITFEIKFPSHLSSEKQKELENIL